MPKGYSRYNNNWEIKEMAILKQNYKLTATEISKMIDRSPKAIRNMFSKLGLERKTIVNDVWSKEEIDLLKKHAGKKKIGELAKLVGRSEDAIKHKYNQLGIDRSDFSGVTYDFKKPKESEDYAYFLGVLAADGWNDGSSIGLSSRDVEFRDAWAEIGGILFDLKPGFRLKKRRLKYHSDLYEAQFHSVRLCSCLGDFSKSNWFNNKNIRFIFGNKKYAAAFLSGYIDSDGHVGDSFYIAVSTDGAVKLAALLRMFGEEFRFCQQGIRILSGLRLELRKWLKLRIKRKKVAL